MNIKNLVYNYSVKLIGILNPLMKLERKIVLNYINEDLIEHKIENLVDIGCSSGQKTVHFNTKFKIIYGLDLDAKAIKKAKKIGEYYNNISFIEGNAENLPFKDDKFDIILCLLSLQHFNNPLKSLKEIKRIGKEDSTIIITIPSTNIPWLKGDFYTTGTRRFTIEEINKMFIESGLEITNHSYFVNSKIAKFLSYQLTRINKMHITFILLLCLITYPFIILLEKSNDNGYLLAIKATPINLKEEY